MDITKAKSAIDAASKALVAAQTAVQDTFTSAAKTGNTEGIVQLVKANQFLGKAVSVVGKASEKLDEAVEKATPKVKEPKADAKAPAAKK